MIQTGGSNASASNASLLGLSGVTETNATILPSTTDSAIPASGSASFTGFAKTPSLNLQYVNFGDWVLRSCADGDSCAPTYVVMIGGGNAGVSPTSTMPTTGAATYKGLATGIIEQSSDVARFKGDLGLTANFATGAIDGQIATILAYDTDTDAQIGSINDIGIAATLSGASYSGTTTAIGRASATFDIAGAAGGISGAFYGPGAAETAGVFYLDGGANNTHLTGAFGAKTGAELITQFREIATISSGANGLTATLNPTLSGVKGTLTSTDNATPSGFSATTAFVTNPSPLSYVVAVAGGANLPTSETVAGQSVTELPLAIAPASTDPAVTISGGGFIDNFADAAGLSYASFGTWTLKPCNNSASCAPAYAGAFGGSQGEAYQTAALPTGTATYAGGATGFVVQSGDAARFYGATTLTANFTTGSVTGGVSNITAYDTNTDAALGSVNSIGITANIAGTGFSGTTSVTGPAGTAFDIAGANGAVNGAFYGPHAEEVAGAFNVTGGANNTTLLGSFGAKR